jgi:predicted DNA-binding protein
MVPTMRRNDSLINFRLPIQMRDALERASNDDRRKMSDYVRLALEEKLERDGYGLQGSTSTDESY